MSAKDSIIFLLIIAACIAVLILAVNWNDAWRIRANDRGHVNPQGQSIP